MATSGPNLPGTGADDAAVGTVAWSSPTNIQADDATYAAASFTGDGDPLFRLTHYLKGTVFGFAIPAGATIDGVVAEIQRYRDAGGEGVDDNVVSLVVNGAVTGDNKAAVPPWPSSEAAASYGGAADGWTAGLTAALVNQANFGLVLQAKLNANDTITTTAYVDCFKITVYYTAAAGAAGVVTGVAMQPLMNF